MTQYLLAVHSSADDYDRSFEEMQPVFETVDRFNQKLVADGIWVFGGGLERIEAATTVDGTNGQTLVIDGPYLETKEYLGGFWVIEAPDLETAHRIALEASEACGGKVEVRPFQAE
ncbi:hypothetical protein ASC61_05310 [Aeromicrobium sp. Root344]|uniref:YciI family protein n=1 Tax=Aeromicrobium sp. Root344 TaxID=1736521 RepID=UPI0006FD6B58|nr:YciI family protein [Aeromicrobium sp. Root344]KQV74465.1 hypothetical protein ASC61_05310 [Aeromicrobium sp. Root344]